MWHFQEPQKVIQGDEFGHLKYMSRMKMLGLTEEMKKMRKDTALEALWVTVGNRIVCMRTADRLTLRAPDTVGAGILTGLLKCGVRGLLGALFISWFMRIKYPLQGHLNADVRR